jgi:hypothetical protein
MLSELDYVLKNLRSLQSTGYTFAQNNLITTIKREPNVTRVLLTQIMTGEYDGNAIQLVRSY